MKILLIGSNGRMGKEMQVFLNGIGAEFYGIDKDNRNNICYSPDVVLDFSSSDALVQNLELAKKLKIPMVIATTNHTKENIEKILAASKSMPVFMSANFSILFNLMKTLCKSIKGEFECLLTESHHKNKKDKPSGSAKVIIKQLNNNGIRPKVVCNRVSDIVGIHSLQVFSKCEELTISHTVYSMQVFCVGAYKACEYIVKKQKGFYGMEDLHGDCL